LYNLIKKEECTQTTHHQQTTSYRPFGLRGGAAEQGLLDEQGSSHEWLYIFSPFYGDVLNCTCEPLSCLVPVLQKNPM